MKGELWYWLGPVQDWILTSFGFRAGERKKEERGLCLSCVNIDFLDLDWAKCCIWMMICKILVQSTGPICRELRSISLKLNFAKKNSVKFNDWSQTRTLHTSPGPDTDCNRKRKWSPDQWRHEQVLFPHPRCCLSSRSSDSAATLTRYFVYCYFRSCCPHFRSGLDRGPCGEGCARTLGWTWGCRAPSSGSRCCRGYRETRRVATLEFYRTGDRWRSRISSPKTYGRSSWLSPWCCKQQI